MYAPHSYTHHLCMYDPTETQPCTFDRYGVPSSSPNTLFPHPTQTVMNTFFFENFSLRKTAHEENLHGTYEIRDSWYVSKTPVWHIYMPSHTRITWFRTRILGFQNQKCLHDAYPRNPDSGYPNSIIPYKFWHYLLVPILFCPLFGYIPDVGFQDLGYSGTLSGVWLLEIRVSEIRVTGFRVRVVYGECLSVDVMIHVCVLVMGLTLRYSSRVTGWFIVWFFVSSRVNQNWGCDKKKYFSES